MLSYLWGYLIIHFSNITLTITLRKATQQISHELMYKTDTTKLTKRLRTATFTITKLCEHQNYLVFWGYQ